MIRRNPALDRLPVSRVTRGGKGKLPVKQESWYTGKISIFKNL
jgi:hypothetical protein